MSLAGCPEDWGAAKALLDEALPTAELRTAVMDRLRQQQIRCTGEAMELKARIVFLVEHPEVLADLILECS